MVDRVITYTQAVPRSEDFLKTEKYGMLGLGYMMQAICGQPQQIFGNVIAWIDGLDCEPAAPPSLNVTVSGGSIYEMETIDATSYGVLGVDTGQVLKQGILDTPVTETITPPATSGYSQYYIIQAIYNDVDGGPTVLPYYNAANPSIPLGGPGNSGQQQYTIRQGKCIVGLKAGVAAPTGSQTIPPADAGFTPLWSILVSNGMTQITSANIAMIKDAPFISPKLTQVPPAIQAQKDNWAVDTGPSANVMQISLPGWTNVIAGLTLRIIKKAPSNTSTPTLSINGGSPVTIAWADGNALAAGDWPAGAIGQITFNGTSWELYSIAGPSIFARVAPGSSPIVTDASLLHYGVDTGTANAASCGSVTPTLTTAVSVGMAFEIQKTGVSNSGSMTVSITGSSGPVVASLYWADGSALQAGDWPASSIALCMFDGTYYRLLSVTKRPVTFPEGAYVHYGVASGTNTLTTSTSPNFTAMPDGLFLELKPTQANTGPVTLAANGLSPSAVTTISGSNLSAGQLQPNQPVLLVAIGGVWKLFGGAGAPGAGLLNIQLLTSSGTYTPTLNTSKALVFATGGGGGGGCSPNIGGGGGAGATAISMISLSGISSVPYIIGAGGAFSNPAPGSNVTVGGGDGGFTRFGSSGSPYCLAPGGSGAQGVYFGVGGGIFSGIIGTMQINGGDGFGSVPPTDYGTGNGGASFWGGGGNGGSLNAQPGRAWGSGGGGVDSQNPTIGNGTGAPGVILVVEFG